MSITDKTVFDWKRQIEAQQKEWSETLKQIEGRKVKILSGYNGQCHGSSRKSLKGTEQVIAKARFSDYCGVMISLVGYEYGSPYLEIDEWEFVK